MNSYLIHFMGVTSGLNVQTVRWIENCLNAFQSIPETADELHKD